MQAIILAAGRGERLRPLTDSLPKQLLPVGGKPILWRTLDQLEQAGVRSIVVVTGYREDQIRRFVSAEFPHLCVRFVRNAMYDRTNTVYSLWLARKELRRGPFLLIDGDLLFEPKVLKQVLSGRGGTIVACDRSVKLDADTVHAMGTPGGQILQIGKRILQTGFSFGESIGLARISREVARPLLRSCSSIIHSRGTRHYYESAFQKTIQNGFRFTAVNIEGAKWIEIDTKSDLRRARRRFSESETCAA